MSDSNDNADELLRAATAAGYSRGISLSAEVARQMAAQMPQGEGAAALQRLATELDRMVADTSARLLTGSSINMRSPRR